ncbi:GTP cyclohydrolase II [Roseovarius sp. MMSF_3350]|uniref:GTP cyclohydrolase II n=1 Tax=Roseovarius sp. MMSF_3350 TaxID=3046706 RepID=UPI00273F7BA0|nr:GTP cyclohydrolase II [Roseovarius sp. MMSF_3350]
MSPVPQSLLPSVAERLSRVQSDLRLGLPCLLTDGPVRAVAVAAETLTQARLDALRDLFGVPELVLTGNRARAAMAPVQSADIWDLPVRIRPPEQADLAWFMRLADAGQDTAGPVAPLHRVRDREARLHGLALSVVKSSELLPAALIFALADDRAIPEGLSMTAVDLAEALSHFAQTPALSPVAAAGLPVEAHDSGKLHVFRDPDGRTEHYAFEIGTPDPARPVLARLHSACFTGDVLGSLKCDCGPQLRAAMLRMGEEGAGLLLYLNQEGRGIGLANKMRVYDLQSRGLDTVDANHALGFEDDERDFRVAAVMLRNLGFGAVRLLTNNPAKVHTFRAQGIEVVEQLPLRVGKNIHNSGYLAVKALKSGHAL